MWDSILEALGYAGSVLDKPGRAVRGLLSGNLREGLAALPGSDTLGLTDERQRTSGSDLLNAIGADGEGVGHDLAGFGVELATDPLMYAGAGLGRVLGRNAEKAAVARGSRTGGMTAEELQAAVKGEPSALKAGAGIDELPPTPVMSGPDAGGRSAQWHADNILADPGGERILREVPSRSKLLGSGAEAIAFTTPEGHVVRIGKVPAGTAGRPVDEGVLQAQRAVDVAGAGKNPYRVEQSQYVKNVQNPEHFTAGRLNEVGSDMEGRGVDFFDRHAGNVGTLEGRPVVIDPGSITTLPSFTGGFQPVTQAREASRPMSALLDALGSDEALRAAYAKGLGGPEFARRLAGYGGFVGGDLGAWGRTQVGR